MSSPDIDTSPTTGTPVLSPAARRQLGGRWIDDWRPEDPDFWATTGKTVARRNLIFSVTSEHIGFSVWSLWSVLVLFLGPGYGFDPAQKFLLTALPTLVGGVLRLPYTFAVGVFGGRNWTIVSALLLLVPTTLIAVVLEPGVSFTTLLVVAMFAGVGGGNFASSMTNINAYYPVRLKGWALGVNAGGGNLGVPVVQLVGLVVLATLGTQHPRAMVAIYIPLVILAAAGAAIFMDNLTQNSNAKGAIREVTGPPGDLDHLAALHRHLRLVHRLQLRLRPGAAGAVPRGVPHPGQGGCADLPRPAARLADPSGSAARWPTATRARWSASGTSSPWPLGAGIVLVASQIRSLPLYVIGFTLLFVFSGLGNGSTYKMIPAIFHAKARPRPPRAVTRGAAMTSAPPDGREP